MGEGEGWEQKGWCGCREAGSRTMEVWHGGRRRWLGWGARWEALPPPPLPTNVPSPRRTGPGNLGEGTLSLRSVLKHTGAGKLTLRPVLVAQA